MVRICSGLAIPRRMASTATAVPVARNMSVMRESLRSIST